MYSTSTPSSHVEESTSPPNPDQPHTVPTSQLSSGSSVDTAQWSPISASSETLETATDSMVCVTYADSMVCSFVDVTWGNEPTPSTTFTPTSPFFPTSTSFANSTKPFSAIAVSVTSSASSTCYNGYTNKIGQCQTTNVSNKTTIFPTATSTYGTGTATDCVSVASDDPFIVWSFLPNTVTVTITVSGNLSYYNTSSTSIWTPPTTCPPPAGTPGDFSNSNSELSATDPIVPSVTKGHSTTYIRPTTIIITNKSTPTVYTTPNAPHYPGVGKPDQKSTVTPGDDSPGWSPINTMNSKTSHTLSSPDVHTTQPPITQPPNTQPPITLSPPVISIPKTTSIVGVPVVVGPTVVVVGSHTVTNGKGSTTVITTNSQTFTVNPSQVIGPGVTIPIPSSTSMGGVPVVVAPGIVVIGSQTVTKGGGSTTTITEDGQTFTINPSQVIGPGAIISLPTEAGDAGNALQPVLSPTVIDGVTVQIGPSVAVIDGSTFSIGLGADTETVVANGQTISIGAAGLGFAHTTVAPPADPTNVVILDGDVVYAYGSSQVVFGDKTYSYSAGSSPQTETFNAETITIGPSGVSFGSSTIGGVAHASGLQIGIAGGVSITEIGSSLAVISGTTFQIGPNAPETTAVISGSTITAGSSGLAIGGATLTYPFNPTVEPTEVVTAGGITFTRVGSSIVDIGSLTFTIGPGAKSTTDVFNGQTISLGPSGIAFKTTTIVVMSSTTTTGQAKSSSKSEARAVRPVWGILGLCIALGVGKMLWV
jgi:hypothetical protein